MKKPIIESYKKAGGGRVIGYLVYDSKGKVTGYEWKQKRNKV